MPNTPGRRTPPQEGSPPVEEESRRTSSIDARKLFSVPLRIFRRSSKIQDAPPIVEPSYGAVTRSDTQHQRHKSTLKQDQTISTLEKASIALKHVKQVRKPKMKSWKIKSASSTSSSDQLETGYTAGKSLNSSANVVTNRSTEVPASATSSILALQRGSTPQNSPAELATYKIKRSRSAETEEFFKIDISIRGQTSYLPSEARRIHTPPLPGNNDDSHNRGFFFDYRVPDGHSPHSFHSSLTFAQDEERKDGESSRILHKNQFVQRVATKLATPLLSPRSPMLGEKLHKAPSRAKTGEWFDARLADLDRASSEYDTSSPPDDRPNSTPSSRECQASMAEMKRREFEAQLDYDIPEHLPSSPLCPRNPKYWRIVKRKGSQFRGCWMHGYGEYAVVPGLSVPSMQQTIQVTTET